MMSSQTLKTECDAHKTHIHIPKTYWMFSIKFDVHIPFYMKRPQSMNGNWHINCDGIID